MYFFSNLWPDQTGTISKNIMENIDIPNPNFQASSFLAYKTSEMKDFNKQMIVDLVILLVIFLVYVFLEYNKK